MSSVNPHDWQRPVVSAMVKAVQTHGVSANTSDTGTGKTLMTCFTAKMLDRALCVVCPKAVIPSWREAAEMTGVPVHFVTNYEQVIRAPKKREWEMAERAGNKLRFHFARWEIHKKIFRWFLPKGSLLVFDEAHRLSGETSQTSKLLVAAKKQSIPTILLSATLADSPIKMKAIGYALDLHKLNSFPYEWRSWLLQNKCEFGDFGGYVYRGGRKHMATLREQMGNRICGVTTRELGDKFPNNNVILRNVPVDVKDIDKEYMEDLKELRATATTSIVEGLRSRQIAEMAKANAMIEMAKDAEAQDYSVMLAVNFTKTHDYIMEKLGRNDCSFIAGGQHPAFREEEIQAFTLNRRPFMVVMIQAGGVGIDGLQDLHGRPRVGIISPSHSAVHFRQVLGRLPRSNSVSPVVQYIVFSEGSKVEERIKTNLGSKLNNLDALNDADLEISL